MNHPSILQAADRKVADLIQTNGVCSFAVNTLEDKRRGVTRLHPYRRNRGVHHDGEYGGARRVLFERPLFPHHTSSANTARPTLREPPKRQLHEFILDKRYATAQNSKALEPSADLTIR